MIVENGTGTKHALEVGSDGKASVDSRSADQAYHVSKDAGLAYVATSIDTAASAEMTAYLKNTDPDRDMIIRSIRCGNVVTTLYKLHLVTGTSSTSAMVPVNKNLGSTNTALATANGNAALTGLTSSAVLGILRVPATDSRAFELEGELRVPVNVAIAVESDTTAGGIEEIEINFFYEAKQ